MKGNIILAWRNIWRNFALIMRSYQLGSYSNWIENLVKTYTGYIQIQEKNYWADKTLENSILWNNNLDSLLSTKSSTMLWTPRLEWGALASNGQQTKLARISLKRSANKTCRCNWYRCGTGKFVFEPERKNCYFQV